MVSGVAIVVVVVVLCGLEADSLSLHVAPPILHCTTEGGEEAPNGNELLTRVALGGDPGVALATVTAKKCNGATHVCCCRVDSCQPMSTQKSSMSKNKGNTEIQNMCGAHFACLLVQDLKVVIEHGDTSSMAFVVTLMIRVIKLLNSFALRLHVPAESEYRACHARAEHRHRNEQPIVLVFYTTICVKYCGW